MGGKKHVFTVISNNLRQSEHEHVPTLPDYPGFSRIRKESPGLPYGSPNLTDKNHFPRLFKLVSPYLNAFLHLGFSKTHTLSEAGCVSYGGEGGSGLLVGIEKGGGVDPDEENL